MKDKYYPYTKKDFSDLYYYEDECKYYSYKILRQLTDNEKKDYEGEYEQECYLIELSNGGELHIYDSEILKEDKINYGNWNDSLRFMLESFEYDDEMMGLFLKECNIKEFYKKYN